MFDHRRQVAPNTDLTMTRVTAIKLLRLFTLNKKGGSTLSPNEDKVL